MSIFGFAAPHGPKSSHFHAVFWNNLTKSYVGIPADGLVLPPMKNLDPPLLGPLQLHWVPLIYNQQLNSEFIKMFLLKTVLIISELFKH